MKKYFGNTKLEDERAKFTRKCECGCSMIIYPTMKKEYTTCRWCGKKLFKDSEKQIEQDKKVAREDFRMKMWNVLCEVK